MEKKNEKESVRGREGEELSGEMDREKDRGAGDKEGKGGKVGFKKNTRTKSR